MTVPLGALHKCNTWRRATTLLPILLFTTLANAQSYEFRDLGAIGGDTNSYGSQPYGINSSGEVVGTSAVPGGSQHAFLWSGSNGMKDLGSLGGNLYVAFGINASSGIAGWSPRRSGASHHAFYWTQTTGIRNLGTLGGSFNEATGSNDSHLIGRFSATVSVWTHLFVAPPKKAMVDSRGLHEH